MRKLKYDTYFELLGISGKIVTYLIANIFNFTNFTCSLTFKLNSYIFFPQKVLSIVRNLRTMQRWNSPGAIRNSGIFAQDFRNSVQVACGGGGGDNGTKVRVKLRKPSVSRRESRARKQDGAVVTPPCWEVFY